MSYQGPSSEPGQSSRSSNWLKSWDWFPRQDRLLATIQHRDVFLICLRILCLYRSNRNVVGFLFPAWKYHDWLANTKGSYVSCHYKIDLIYADYYELGHYECRFDYAAHYSNYDHLASGNSIFTFYVGARDSNSGLYLHGTSYVGQASLKPCRSTSLCLPGTGVKGLDQHTQL